MGYANVQTDIKQARFFGANESHVLSGSDDGRVFIWDKATGVLVKTLVADEDIVNCVQVSVEPTPCHDLPMLMLMTWRLMRVLLIC